MIGSLGPQITATLQTMSQWINLAALVVGAVLGLLLARVLRRAGCESAALLALLFAPAALLEPTTALIALGAAWAAALVTLQADGANWRPLIAILATAIGAALLLAPLLNLVPRLEPLESSLLLVAAAAASILIASGSETRTWISALGLTLVGIAAEFSQWPPIDGSKTSPRWLLCGLMLIGPALIAAMLPSRALKTTAAGSGLEVGAALLPLSVLALPIATTGALLLLVLGEHGLNGGQMLLVQRPRMAIAFVSAMLAAGLAVALFLYTTQAFWAARLSQRLSAATLTRLAGALTLAIVAGLVVRLGLEPAEQLPAAIAAGVGAILAALGISPAPLLIGLVIGERLQASAPAAMKAALSGPRPILIAGLAVLSVACALTWPQIRRRLGQAQPA